MKPWRKSFINLIILIVFKCMFKCNNALNLARSGLCSLDTSGTVPNICDRSKYLVYGIEVKSGCQLPGTKCWCILVDNRNRDYDGDIVIELVQIFNRGNLHPDEIQYGDVKSYLSFQIIPGINRLYVQPYTPPEAQSNITSIKIRNIEICKFINTDFQQTTLHNRTPFLPDDDPSDEEYRFFADCMHRKEYTENSIRFCPNYRPEFMIEKRFTQNNSAYWCININNDKYSLTSENHLHIVYSSPNRYFVYSPIDVYTEREAPGSDFHLGNQRTIIAISKNNNQLANLRSVTIDQRPICSYFGTPIITNPPEIGRGPDKPAPNIPEIPGPVIPGPDIPGPDIPGPDINRDSINTCGIKPIHKNSLISFGFNTNPGDWPWHAAIYKLKTKTNRDFICGGTLISLKSIVTAAHCVLEINLVVIPERLIVELGRHDLTISSVATQEYHVYDIIQHHAYNPDSFENDIAILLLANYVHLTKYVHFVCLPNHNDNLQNKIGTTVGWGRDEQNQLQTDLQEANLPVIDRITCLTSNREFFKQYLTDTNF